MKGVEVRIASQDGKYCAEAIDAGDLRLNLREVPYSCRGSYFAIAYADVHRQFMKGLYLKTVHGGAPEHEFFEICPNVRHSNIRSNDGGFVAEAGISGVRIRTEAGEADFCIYGRNSVRVRGTITIRLEKYQPGAYEYAIRAENGMVQIVGEGSKFQFIPHKGEIILDAPWEESRCTSIAAELRPLNGEFDITIEEIENAFLKHEFPESLEVCRADTERDFGQWLEKTVSVPKRFAKARVLAAYLNWSSLVAPYGLLKREAMLMSKNWMANVWSWDHCFNAMALAEKNPAAAWEQFRVIMDFQDENGAFPDYVNDRRTVRTFVKPPIHGWTLNWLLDHDPEPCREALTGVYDSLSKCTKYWFNCMDTNHNGVPQYNHGNDSGWDNSTVFRIETPVETPDLSAFLVLQTEALSRTALLLERPDEADAWTDVSLSLLKRLISYFRDGNRLTARLSGSGEKVECESLIQFLPLILGKRLPMEIREEMTARLLEGGWLTRYGFATENPESPYYREDGYWRGPIWAPPTLMLCQALKELGREKEAAEAAEAFCQMCAAHGMAENFNALTGEALRDKAYTWTSSVFLLLAHELEGN